VEHSLLSFAAMADRAVLAKPDRPTGGCDFDVVVTAAGHWFAVLWTPRRTETPLGEKLELAVMDMLPEEMFGMTARWVAVTGAGWTHSRKVSIGGCAARRQVQAIIGSSAAACTFAACYEILYTSGTMAT